MRFATCICVALAVLAAPTCMAAARYSVAVHSVGGRAKEFANQLIQNGMEAALLSDAQLADPSVLSATRFDALLLPDASNCPLSALQNMLAFLRAGGDLLVVGGPLFESSAKAADAAWQRTLQRVAVSHPVVDLGRTGETQWQRSAGGSNASASWRLERSGPPASPAALHVEVTDPVGWDVLATAVGTPFAPGEPLTVFWAKADASTKALTVEWQERDGSRWMTAVPLSTRWRRYVLDAADFAYWPDNPSKGRGGAGDHLNPANAVRLSVGLAQQHGPLTPGKHSYWITTVGAARLPSGVQRPSFEPPVLETLSPFYKYYRLPSVSPKPAGPGDLSTETGNQTGPVVTPIPRPRGLGFSSDGRHGRWIPIAEIRDQAGKWRGTLESLYLNLDGEYKGAIFGQLAGAAKPTDLPRAAAMLARRISQGLFLGYAGAEGFSYFEDEGQIPIGAVVANSGHAERRATVRMQAAGPGGRISLLDREVTVTPGAITPVRADWAQSSRSPGIYTITTQLLENGRVIDSIQQQVSILAAGPAPSDAFVSAAHGDFWEPSPQRGADSASHAVRKWYPYGVNYWQSNVAGTDPEQYRLHWLSASFYDPQVVERDLRTLESLGFTSVSIQLNEPSGIRQANDFVARAARHGIRTNLFIGGAHPFYTDEKLFTRLITEGRFAQNPNIWAYDIAWEHHLGNHEERARWDREWEQWVIDRYGTIQHAEQNWGFPIPRNASGQVTNPSDDQLRRDGPWLKMVAAYERCADDVISRRYGAVIRKIRALDAHHLISARSASQPSWTGWFAYDLISCGKHFDFSSPEGYGLDPSEAGFTTAYARYAGNGNPVFWAEFGSSIYPYDTTGEKAAAQAKLHSGFAQMLLKSGANGLASWWSVGGYRVDERSDFGIIAPDGTPRPSALELKRHASQATTPRPVPSPTIWVTVDRDLHAAAYQAVYESNKRFYVEAVKQGGMVGVRTAGTGTTSADCPLVAVGNVPYDGFNPLKYLNAEFNSVQVMDAEGEWQEAQDGKPVTVAAGKPVMVKASVGNTGDARWLAGEAAGAVRLVGDPRPDERSSGLPRLTFGAPISRDVARYEDVEIGPVTVSSGLSDDSEVVLTLEARDRAYFGERRHILLKVAR